jgi:hypothetical protein
MIDYNKEGDLHLVTMNAGPNVICPEWQQRMLDILDRVEAGCGQGAALVLAGQGPGQSAGHQRAGYLQNPQANLVRAYG